MLVLREDFCRRQRGLVQSASQLHTRYAPRSHQSNNPRDHVRYVDLQSQHQKWRCKGQQLAHYFISTRLLHEEELTIVDMHIRPYVYTSPNHACPLPVQCRPNQRWNLHRVIIRYPSSDQSPRREPIDR